MKAMSWRIAPSLLLVAGAALVAGPLPTQANDGGCMENRLELDILFHDIWHGPMSISPPEVHEDCDPIDKMCEWSQPMDQGFYSGYHLDWQQGSTYSHNHVKSEAECSSLVS